MKFFLQLILVSSVLLGSMSARADDTYLGVAYHTGSYDETGFETVSPTAIKLKAGKYVAKNVAIEGHMYFGTASDSLVYFGQRIDLELKNAISVFVKGDLPLSATANLYGLVGLTKGKLVVEVPSVNYADSVSDSSLSYGFGAEIAVGNDMYVSGEYIMYISESAYDYSGFNIGLSKKF